MVIMEIILKEDVENLGLKDEIILVKMDMEEIF